MIPDEEWEGRMRAFQQYWGSFDLDTFKRVLQEGNEADRLVALFAPGYLAYEETRELLAPFLSSPVGKERWASAIVLGERKDERGFAVLGELLVENLAYFSQSSDEQKIRDVVDSARKQAREHDGSYGSWERFVYPGLVQAWSELEVYRSEYTWYMFHRQTITNILRAWNDPRTIPMFRQALQTCWQIEQLPRGQGCPPGSLRDLHQLEDKLAYALGELEAWNALDGLDTGKLHPSRFKLARLYLIFGSFHLNLSSLEYWNINTHIQTGAIDPDRVTHLLQERFGLDEYLARANLNVFHQWYQERDDLWQWQRRIARGEIDLH